MASKIKRIKEKKFTFSGIMFVLLSLILTIGLFFALIVLQNRLSNQIVYKEVVVAKQEIPEGLVLSETNISQYLTNKNINILDATGDSLADKSVLIGKQAKVRLVPGEPVMMKDFNDTAFYIQDFANPIEISIDVSTIANADAGKLRQGDLVNIVMTKALEKSDSSIVPDNVPSLVNGNEEEFAEADKENNKKEWAHEFEAAYVMENVYVKNAMDSAGAVLSPVDKEANANILVLVIDKKDELIFNTALANGDNLRLSKILNPDPATADNVTEEVVEEPVTVQESSVTESEDYFLCSDVTGNVVLMDEEDTPLFTLALSEGVTGAFNRILTQGAYTAVVSYATEEQVFSWAVQNTSPESAETVELPENTPGYTGGILEISGEEASLYIDLGNSYWLVVTCEGLPDGEGALERCTELLNYLTEQ